MFLQDYTAIRAGDGVGMQKLPQKGHPQRTYLVDIKWIHIPETFLFPNDSFFSETRECRLAPAKALGVT